MYKIIEDIAHSTHQAELMRYYNIAAVAHAGQQRKWTGEPYLIHPVAVAKMVSQITSDWRMIGAALLHDVVEDCGYSEQLLREEGVDEEVIELVLQLTNDKSKTRKVRKLEELERLGAAGMRAQTIKCCDIADNAATMHLGQASFSRQWLDEATLLHQSFKYASKHALDIAELMLKSLHFNIGV